MTPPPPSNSKNSGIDIRDALSILSSRAKSGGDSNLTDSSVPDELKEMGQTIDIVDEMEFANNDAASGCDCATDNGNSENEPSPLSEEDAKKHEAIKAERAKRGEEIKAKLSSMDVSDLLGMIFQAQQERVATYKIFEGGISTILVSGNITNYPTLCAKVTASFSVLSDTINAVKSTLEEHPKKRTDITSVITQLQKSEGEKLNLTAALHLEKLRLRNSQLELGEGSKAFSSSDERTIKLLKDGIHSLECKISTAVEKINEDLEELRCIFADE